MTKIEEHNLPKTPEAEQAVLGAALLEPAEVMPVLRESLTANDFWPRAHQLIFRAILDALDDGTPDGALLHAVGDLLEQRNQLDAVGGRAYLSELIAKVTTTASVPYYTEKIKDCAERRDQIVVLERAKEKLLKESGSATAVLEEIAAQAKAEKVAAAAIATDSSQAPTGIEFPKSSYVGIAREFAQLYSQYVESPPQFLLMAFLTYLGTLLADKITVASELRPQPRLFAVLLGESSNARKSAALDFVDRFYREIFALNVHYGLGSAEGLAAELESDGNSPRSLILHCDELKLLVDKASQDGSVALPMLTTLFERNVFDNTTKGKKIRVRNGYLSLVSACTTETYQRMWHPSFRDIGFINRLFLVHGDAQRRFFSPRQVPEAERRRLQDDLVGLVGAIAATVEARKRPIEMVFDPEAEHILQDWYMRLSSSVHERRLEVYGLRLCILLEVCQGETRKVTKETALAVRDLLDYELAVRRLHDPIDADTLIARVEESIRRALATSPLTERDLKRRVSYQRVGVWVFNQALTNLQNAGEVRFLSNKRRLGLVDCQQKCQHMSERGENAE